MRKEASVNTYGAAAVDYYAPARRSSSPVALPEEQLQPQKVRKVRVRAKTMVAPFTVLGFGVAIVMLILVIFGYVQLYEATSRNAELADEAAQLRETNTALVNQYEGQIDLSHIEYAAINELGMQKALADQTVYVDLSCAADKGVVLASGQHNSVLREVYETLRDSLKALLEYLS